MLPTDPAARKAVPIYSGCVRYFPAALAAVAKHSAEGNRQHNGEGAELFHDRAKSGDELDALMRHLMEGDLVSVAWRALAALQKQCESEGAPVAPAARNAAPFNPNDHIARNPAYDAGRNPPATDTGD